MGEETSMFRYCVKGQWDYKNERDPIPTPKLPSSEDTADINSKIHDRNKGSF